MIKKAYYRFLLLQNAKFAQAATRATKWLGYSSRPVHPKHLFDHNRNQYLAEFYQKGSDFLDLGCGVGTDCITAKKRGALRCVGIDFDEKNIATAKFRAQQEGLEVEFNVLNLDQGSLPFETASFDFVNATDVVEHLHNRIAFLKEVKRVLRKDGIVLITIPQCNASWKKKLRSVGLDSRDDRDHKIEYDESTLAFELNEAGLIRKSELMPVVPSFPWHGLMAFSFVISPTVYRFFQRYKRSYVKKCPHESNGWTFIAG